MNKTDIEWTTFSANPMKYRRKSDGKVVWACVKESPGCAHCYSEAIALRFDRGKLYNARNMEELEPFLDDAALRKMRTAKVIGGQPVAGSRCFVGDMTDLFGAWVPDELLNRLFSSVLELRTDVTWQLLTKHAARMCSYLSWRWGEGRIPSRNIHVGVSVEDQQRADGRIPHLLKCPAAVRFLSVEPLLGPVNLERCAPYALDGDTSNPGVTNAFNGLCYHPATVKLAPEKKGTKDGISWVIVGGESGHDARPNNLSWDLSILRQCQAAGVAAFQKQTGSYPVVEYYADGEAECLREWALDQPHAILAPYHGNHFIHGPHDGQPPPFSVIRVKLKDLKGGDMEEWPEDLRVRQFPEVRA